MNPGFDFSKLFPKQTVQRYKISKSGARGYFVTEDNYGIVTIHHMVAQYTVAPATGVFITDPSYWDPKLTNRVSMLVEEYLQLFSDGQLNPNSDPAITGQIIKTFTVGGGTP